MLSRLDLEVLKYPQIELFMTFLLFLIASDEKRILPKVPMIGEYKKVTLKDALRHFLYNGGKIFGRHYDEDLSPVEIIN